MAESEDTSSFNPKHRIAGAIILVSLAVIFLPLILSNNAPPPSDTENVTVISVQESEESVVMTSAEEAATEKVIMEPAPAVKGIVAVEVEAPAIAPSAPKIAPVAESAGVQVKTEAKAAAEPASVKSEPKRIDTQPLETATGVTAAAKPTLKPVKASLATTQNVLAKPWMVQVGTYANVNNATRISDQLAKQGFNVRLEDVMLSSGKAIRVRVGPYQNKLLASKAQTKISQDIGIKGIVIAPR